MRAEYTREVLGKGVRGFHFAAFSRGTTWVALTPERMQFPLADESIKTHPSD